MNFKQSITFSSAAALGILAAVALSALSIPSAGAASPPSLKMTSGPYHNGQSIKLSVGPNHYFKPYSHVNILECADPGGKKSHLPINADACDGNTIQGDTVLVAADGSFSETGYQLYSLPNRSALGELADTRPICDSTHDCVLYVGENQLNFTSPKLFSHPFTIRKAGKHS
jgi:hypothetical protein